MKKVIFTIFILALMLLSVVAYSVNAVDDSPSFTVQDAVARDSNIWNQIVKFFSFTDKESVLSVSGQKYQCTENPVSIIYVKTVNGVGLGDTPIKCDSSIGVSVGGCYFGLYDETAGNKLLGFYGLAYGKSINYASTNPNDNPIYNVPISHKIRFELHPCDKTVAVTDVCFDSDGTDYFTKGYVKVGASVMYDSCDGYRAIEETCVNNARFEVVKDCNTLGSNTCSDGRCQNAPISYIYTCKDGVIGLPTNTNSYSGVKTYNCGTGNGCQVNAKQITGYTYSYSDLESNLCSFMTTCYSSNSNGALVSKVFAGTSCPSGYYYDKSSVPKKTCYMCDSDFNLFSNIYYGDCPDEWATIRPQCIKPQITCYYCDDTDFTIKSTKTDLDCTNLGDNYFQNKADVVCEKPVVEPNNNDINNESSVKDNSTDVTNNNPVEKNWFQNLIDWLVKLFTGV